MKSFQEILNEKCIALGWRDSTEAYYGLYFTPFMSIIEEAAEAFKQQSNINIVKLKS
jgi:hypothetical protein